MVTEELAQIGKVRFIIKSESATVIEEDAKFVGEATTKKIGRSHHFLLMMIICTLSQY